MPTLAGGEGGGEAAVALARRQTDKWLMSRLHCCYTSLTGAELAGAKAGHPANKRGLITDRYRKRFYTLGGFGRDLVDMLRHLPDLRAAARGGRIGRAFAERVMFVVSQVNGCRYCSYFHTRMALRSGVSEAEIARLVALDLASFPEEEAVALAFAQHYAESDRRPSPEAWQRFLAYYGPAAGRDIMAYIRMITMGNLAGNTVDAFLSRMRGRAAEGSNPLGEFLLFLLFAPFTLPLLGRIRRAEQGGAGESG